jgi:molybdenum cofactor cytidylyltransferase
MTIRTDFAIILLAAGSSSRMGQSKQLLNWGDKTLLEHAATTALGTNPESVVVVLGANEQSHQTVLKNLDVAIVVNPQWQMGMGSSIKVGLKFLVDQSPKIGGVVIMVCDQPFITSQHLQNMVAQHEKTGYSIIATKYTGLLGVPVFFSSKLFKLLEKIEDTEGAKKLVHQNPQLTDFVPLEEGKIDLDTPDDYANFVIK